MDKQTRQEKRRQEREKIKQMEKEYIALRNAISEERKIARETIDL